jgi:hypothetical protein
MDCFVALLLAMTSMRAPEWSSRALSPLSAAAHQTRMTCFSGYFSILLWSCQKRTVRWAVSIDSFL